MCFASNYFWWQQISRHFSWVWHSKTTVMTKSRFVLFKLILIAKVRYARAIIWFHNRKYMEKWETMLYRLLKRMFWIKMNVIKQRLFKILGIKNNSEYIYKNRVLLKKIRKWLRVIEFLSIKLIKTKLNCLFQRKPVKPKWNWGWIIDENHASISVTRSHNGGVNGIQNQEKCEA